MAENWLGKGGGTFPFWHHHLTASIYEKEFSLGSFLTSDGFCTYWHTSNVPKSAQQEWEEIEPPPKRWKMFPLWVSIALQRSWKKSKNWKKYSISRKSFAYQSRAFDVIIDDRKVQIHWQCTRTGGIQRSWETWREGGEVERERRGASPGKGMINRHSSMILWTHLTITWCAPWLSRVCKWERTKCDKVWQSRNWLTIKMAMKTCISNPIKH